MLKIKKLYDNTKVTLPREGDAGIDLHAHIKMPYTLHTGCIKTVPSGIAVAIPEGWVGLVFPRSGLGSKGLVLGNLTGVIDSSYRGEIQIPLWNRNHDNWPFVIEPMMKVAQLVIVPHWDNSSFEFVEELNETERGTNGFGSTGK